MLPAGTTCTELDQVASFWFALTDTWRGGAPPHLRPHTCSGQLCELPPVTAPASTGPADLPSLLARRRKRHPDLSRQRRPALAFPERPGSGIAVCARTTSEVPLIICASQRASSLCCRWIRRRGKVAAFPDRGYAFPKTGFR